MTKKQLNNVFDAILLADRISQLEKSKRELISSALRGNANVLSAA